MRRSCSQATFRPSTIIMVWPVGVWVPCLEIQMWFCRDSDKSFNHDSATLPHFSGNLWATCKHYIIRIFLWWCLMAWCMHTSRCRRMQQLWWCHVLHVGSLYEVSLKVYMYDTQTCIRGLPCPGDAGMSSALFGIAVSASGVLAGSSWK